MVDIEKITNFLGSLTAISQTQYQIWDAKGQMVFCSDQDKIDFLTTSYYMKMAKRVIQSDAFAYTPTAHNGFLCGIPLEMDVEAKGAILAMGLRPKTTNEEGHPEQLHQFLRQITMMGRNGNPRDDGHCRPTQPYHDHNFEDLSLFANISKQFRSLRFKQPILGKLLHRMFDTMDADAAFMQLDQLPQYDLLEIRPALLKEGHPHHLLNDGFQQLIASAVTQCRGNYRIVDDSREDEGFKDLLDQPFRFLAVAVRHIKWQYGWLGFVSFKMETKFKPEELTILQTLANQLATMLANMEQHDDLERFTVNIVCSLVNAIEAKDTYCRGHSKRVHQFAMQIASHIDLPDHDRNGLKWAAVLHDIGKIGIPERILCKPGKLTDQEFEMIKQHPLKGKSILSPIGQLAPSMEAIAHHHERYDGTGYPDGLKGEEIPLTARIISVADAFDAITSLRSYRAAKTPSEALQELEQVAGIQLDPHLVKIFCQAYRQQ